MKIKNNTFLRRGITALVSLFVILSVNAVSFSADLNDDNPTISEEIIYTATAFVISNDNHGNLSIEVRVTVEGSNVNIAENGDFSFLWQFSETNVWTDNVSTVGGSSGLHLTNAVTAGIYRCVVTYTGRWDVPENAPEPVREFISNSVRITENKTQISDDYTAFILGSIEPDGNNTVKIHLDVEVRNQIGQNVTNSGDFAFQWERQEKGFNNNPIGNFEPVAGETSSEYERNSTLPSFYRCRVTYIGNGDFQGASVFYTEPVEWTPILSYTPGIVNIIPHDADTPILDVTLRGQFTNVTPRAEVLPASITPPIPAGRLRITIPEGHNLQAGGSITTIQRSIQLFRVGTDEQTGGNLFEGVEIIANMPNGNSAYTYTTAAPIPGDGRYYFVLRVWRTTGGNFDITISGDVIITATATSAELTDIEHDPIPAGGLAGGRLNGVDYSTFTYVPSPAGYSGEITVVIEHPAHWVRFDRNGGTGGTMSEEIIRRNNDYTIKPNTFSKTGWSFVGWNTAVNQDGEGIGDFYTAGATISDLRANTTLYAMWVQGIFAITYNPGEGTGSMPSSSVSIGNNYTIANNTFTPPSMIHIFDSWNTAADGSGTSYAEGGIISNVQANITLYAQWKINIFNITYNSNGGSGTMIPEPTDFVYSGGSHTVRGNGFSPPLNREFGGWNTQPDGLELETGTAYEPGYPILNIQADITLYAQWLPIPPELNFTDRDGGILSIILLPSDTDVSGILSGSGLRVYFKLEYGANEENITFIYGNGNTTITYDDFKDNYDTDKDVWYFDLDDVEGLLQNADSMEIRGFIDGVYADRITIRRVGLFNLY